jgi:DNA-binding NtrC family response regulator
MEPLIMIVDDDNDIRELLEILILRFLESEARQKVDLRSFAGPFEALSALDAGSRNRDVCLISDIGMPGMNGIDLLHQMEMRLGRRLVTKALHSGELDRHHPRVDRTGAILIPKAGPDSNDMIRNVVRTFMDAATG